MLIKWKFALINRLKDLKKTMAGIFQQKERGVPEDRHKEEEALSGSEDGRAGIFSRRYLLLAGIYLVTVVLLLSFVILRWGSVPSPEIPGVEREIKYSFEEEDNVEYAEEEVGEIYSGLQVSENNVIPEAVDDIEKPGDETDHELQESVETFQPADVLLMQAASPLSQWSLHHSYGSYVAEKLPSGGKLHRLLNGAFFRGVPGAPVAALWDGYVLTVGEKEGSYSPYVLLQHDGGYMTFYGNLKEVWVAEGSYISRGENLGILPSEEGISPVTTAEGASRKVPIRTIYKGIAGEVTSGWNSEEWQTKDDRSEPAMAAVSTFYKESPLLYLEVRQGSRFIDPLKFIHTRN
ncbi:MAG: M23 family metallopeptidase [Bacillota bacterium]|nr:M23 family metallopeptidase [Bacillota bacterium]